jgi:hypothetical protein
MRILISVLFVFVAIVNLLPGLGVLSAQRLEGFYGVALQDPNLVVLMRHRAVTLAIVGGLLAVAAFQPALRGAAIVAGFVSMLSFIALAAGSSSPELRKVLIVDVIATLALVAAAILDRVRKAPVI